MSDYFQNLVGVARGEPTRVRPLIRSYYETPLGESGVTRPHEQNVEQPAAGHRRPENVPPASAPTMPAASAEKTPAPGKLPASVVQKESRKSGLLFPTRATSEDRVNFEAPKTSSQMAGPEASPPVAPTRAPDHSPPRTRAESTNDEPLLRPRREAPQPEFSPTGFRPRVIDRSPSSASPSGSERGESLSRPPDIHVTIGRIEVRTAAPTAERAAPRAKPAAPSLSLDQYLKARDGGKS